MRTFKVTLTALIMIAAFTSLAVAGDADSSQTKDAPKELKHQTHCPVMGGEIDSTAYTDIQGQRVYHCCPMCTKKLKADPDKYFEKAAEEGILFENIQTTCPVAGHKLEEKTIFTDYVGRRLYFCSEEHVKKFNEDPQMYLKMMDEPSAAGKMMDHMKNMDHMHHSDSAKKSH